MVTSSMAVPTPLPKIYELMNVAYAWHEINGEYVTACLAWFESK